MKTYDWLASGGVVDLMPQEDRDSMLRELIDMLTDPNKPDDVLLADLRSRIYTTLYCYEKLELESGE